MFSKRIRERSGLIRLRAHALPRAWASPSRRQRGVTRRRSLAVRESFLCRRCQSHFTIRRICHACRDFPHPGASDWIALLADRNRFTPLGSSWWADPLGFVDELSYTEQIRRARLSTGALEAVSAGAARIGGHPAAVIAFDFNFLGGSLGVASGETVVEAFEYAVRERRPVVMIVASSGARMQEGLAALFQMARASAAVARLHRAGLPLIAVLANPTTGAPYASCANLADVLLAEPGALIGFAGPRVVAAVTGKLRDGRRAEELALRGMVDKVVPRQALRREIGALLDLLDPRPGEARPGDPELPPPPPASDRWSLLSSVRDPTWPTGVRWLEVLSDRRFELVGDRAGGDDAAIRCALAEIAGRAMLVLAQDRLAGDGLIRAAGYRKALRALRIASRLRLPVLSLVDTYGADVGPEADDDGIAHWIAECFAALLELPVPVVSVVVGQGSSGGALALAIADRIYMLEQSVFSVIAPEGAAAILSKSRREPCEWAEKLKLSAADAFELGLVDGVIPGAESGRRARERRIRHVRELLPGVLAQLDTVEPDVLVDQRVHRYLHTSERLLRPA